MSEKEYRSIHFAPLKRGKGGAAFAPFHAQLGPFQVTMARFYGVPGSDWWTCGVGAPQMAKTASTSTEQSGRQRRTAESTPGLRETGSQKLACARMAAKIW
eukprot:COSAG02_NODE_1820_length_10770_cov_89.157905_2_plen_101_part_00